MADRCIKRCGIYVIQNNINQKKYIGYSRHITKRKYKHLNGLRKNTHGNQHLQNSWNKYGEENFSTYIIEICDNSLTNSELEAIETKWVLHFNSHQREFGYNATLPGQIPLKELEDNIIKKERLHPIICINKISKKIVEYNNATEVEKALGLKRNKVNDCCLYWEGKPQSKKKGWKGWLFVRKSNYLPDFDYISHHRNKKPK